MRRYLRFAAAACASGVLLFGTGLASAAVPASPLQAPAQTPAVPMAFHFYSVSTESQLYTANGQVVSNPNTAPAVGDWVVSADNDYLGTQADHAATPTATDHLFCLVTATPATALCSAEVAIGDSMFFADHSVQDFASNSPTTVFTVTGGTGAYQGVHGTVTVTQTGNSNNSEAVISLAK